MKLRPQILFAQLPSVIVIILTTVFFILVLITIEKKSESILLDNFNSILAMQRINDYLEDLNGLNTNTPQKNTIEKKELEIKIAKQLIIQEEIPGKQAEQENLTERLHQNWETYKAQVINPSLTKQELEKLNKDLKSVVRNIIELNLDELIRKKANISSFISNMIIFVTIGPAFILIFSFFASWILTGLLLNPLDKMAEVMREVGKGGSKTLIQIKGSDEIEKLSEEFNLMTHRLDIYHRSSLGHVLREYQTLKTAIDFIPNPILLFNHNKELIYSNSAARRTLGIPENFKMPNTFINLENQSQENLNKIINTVFITKNPFIPENPSDFIALTNESKRTFYLPLVYPLKKTIGYNDSQLDGIFIILEDLTHQRMSYLSTTEVYETLIHEFLSLLRDVHLAIYTCVQEAVGPLTPKQQEILYSAREKCESLETLCQDLLNFSQINQMTPKLNKEEVDLVQVVSNLISSLQLDSFQKGLFIDFREPPFLSSINISRKQVEILIGNLIRNALQYANPATTIKINLKNMKNFIEFSVNNEGAQIPPEYHKDIFKKYFKIPRQSSESAGLGLYIAKQITDSIGGTIGFKSTPKRGTTFWVHLPITHEPSEKSQST